ncbi:hypothetical protein TrVE_jg14266 [Triparma verrucosa]|uniref:DNA polymerase eta n=1 Tax=Triparma verrucosa TaxID=1606542 RepID=A0A9W7C558_9STRA|nr:hypothetical protein TrVE_jg14266 [Triparma verrucosa]
MDSSSDEESDADAILDDVNDFLLKSSSKSSKLKRQLGPTLGHANATNANVNVAAIPTIFHVDVDNFYVNVHRVHSHNLLGLQVVIVQKNGGGIVALSEEAKDAGLRKYDGIAGNGAKMLGRKGNRTIQELKRSHPEMVVVEMNTDLYRSARDLVRAELKKVTGGIVQGVSYDDSFILMPSNNGDDKDVEQTAFDLRRKIKERSGYDITIGVGGCKTVARLAGARAKRGRGGNGVYVVKDSKAAEFLHSSFLREIKQGFGGEKGKEYCSKLLEALSGRDGRTKFADDIASITVRDALMLGEKKLGALLPVELVARLLLWGNGEDDDEVTPTQVQKSILCQQACCPPKHQDSKIPNFDESLLNDLCMKLVERVVEDGRMPRCLSIVFRDGYFSGPASGSSSRGSSSSRKVGDWRRDWITEDGGENLFRIAKQKFTQLQKENNGLSFTRLGVRAEFDEEREAGTQNIKDLFETTKRVSKKPRLELEEESTTWACPRCTYSNAELFLICEMCGTAKK